MKSIAALHADPAAFRQKLLIDTDAGPAPLDRSLDPWQRADFEALDPAWRRVAGHDVATPRLRAWLERPRGHSKTSDLAVMACWAIAFSPRRLSGVVAAGDRDQAKLMRDAIARLVQLNPLLKRLVDVQASRVVNPHTDSTLTMLSADVSSSWGILPDFVLLDEVTHWSNRELFDSLFSSAAKRADCLLVTITNAGRHGSWQWDLRELVREDSAWYFHSLDGPQASWISEATLAEQRRILPPSAFARLWLNRYVSGGDLLSQEDLLAAVTLEHPWPAGERGCRYLIGLDLGTRRDFAAMVVVAADWQHRRVRLCCSRSWAPAGDVGVDLIAVKSAVLEVARRYGADVWADPTQAHLLLQQLREDHVTCNEVPFTGKALSEMASATLQGFTERRIDLYDERDLIGQLGLLSIVQRSFGFKIEAPRDSKLGHCDKAIALSLILPPALAVAMGNDSGPLVVHRGCVGLVGGLGQSQYKGGFLPPD